MKQLWLVGLIIFGYLNTTHAQNIENVKTAKLLGKFKESFDERAKVSGTPIAGVKLAGPILKARQPAKLVLTPDGQNTEICVETKTRDGRYNSLNHYSVSGLGLGLVPAKIDPTTVRFQSELSSYNDDDFAVLTSLRVDKHCSLKEAVLFPRVFGPQWERKVIFEVNSRSRLASVVTRDHDDQLIGGICTATDHGANIAFDKRCTLDLTVAEKDIFQVKLKLDDGFGEEVHEFSVYVPKNAQ